MSSPIVCNSSLFLKFLRASQITFPTGLKSMRHLRLTPHLHASRKTMSSTRPILQSEHSRSTHHTSRSRQRRFQPLNPTVQSSTTGIPKLQGIVFDVDGTLCLPQNHMFGEMRSALDIPKSVDILEHVRGLSDVPDGSLNRSHGESKIDNDNNNDNNNDNSSSSTPTINTTTTSDGSGNSNSRTSPRSRAQTVIRTIERRAMTSQTPQPGLSDLMSYLSQRGVRKGLCTRNFEEPVRHLLRKFLPDEKFEPVVTRETEGVKPKPDPDGVWECGRVWKGKASREEGRGDEADEDGREIVDNKGGVVGQSGDSERIDVNRHLGANLIMIGDSFDDMAAGHRAGAATVLLVQDHNRELEGHEFTDLGIARLDDLIEILEEGFVGRMRESETQGEELGDGADRTQTEAEEYWVEK